VVSRVRRRVSIRLGQQREPEPEQQPDRGADRRADLAPNDRRLFPDLLGHRGQIVNFVCGGVLSCSCCSLAVCRLVLLFEGVALGRGDVTLGPWLRVEGSLERLERGRQVVCLLHECGIVCCRFSVAVLGQRGLDLRGVGIAIATARLPRRSVTEMLTVPEESVLAVVLAATSEGPLIPDVLATRASIAGSWTRTPAGDAAGD